MAEKEDILNYVRSALSKGYEDSQIKQALSASGWSEKDVDRALKEARGIATGKFPSGQLKIVLILLFFLIGFAVSYGLALSISEKQQVCGNEAVEGSESCDDGDLENSDGCSSLCNLESGWLCSGSPSKCSSICGDGIKVNTESCDDGNRVDGDGCSSICIEQAVSSVIRTPAAAICGDGVKTNSESCDDGNNRNNDGCSSVCTVDNGYQCTLSGSISQCVPLCGDGILKGAELCDDSNTNNNDGCSSTCTLESGWSCSGSPSSCSPICGDGIKKGLETCDKGFPPLVSNGTNNKTCTALYGETCSYCSIGCVLVVVSGPKCGDGKVNSTKGEICDDGNTKSNDGCSSSCKKEKGWNCPATGGNCTAICGDGFTRGTEQCDDNKTISGDGCSTTCRFESGYTCSGQPSVCRRIICGDNLCEGSETNVNCPSDCPAVCGNGARETGEACDNGVNNGNICTASYGSSCQYCSSNCQNIIVQGSRCGDNTVNPLNGEACDHGNLANNDGCSSSCTLESGWSCPGSPSSCSPNCGDGVIKGGEQCDDHNTLGGDGCSSSCTVETGYHCSGTTSVCTTSCGDGITGGSEICDGNTQCTASNGYPGTRPCNALCTAYTGSCTSTLFCGDNAVNGNEQCDGTALNGQTCVTKGYTSGTLNCAANCLSYDTSSCSNAVPQICGNSLVNAPETCDDGNLTNNDGCSSLCNSELGWSCSGAGPGSCLPVCGDGITKGTETCDDGNMVSYDGCSSSCTLESISSCGDGLVEGNEQCDGANLNSQTCVARNYTSGTLSCDNNCYFNPLQCDGTLQCIDSDGGNSPAVKGNITMPALNNLRLYDVCDTSTVLKERVCESSTNYSLNTISQTCANGCLDGACLGTPTVINGACGALNTCTPGTLNNIPDTVTNYLWNCTGSNGGSTASCTLPKPFGYSLAITGGSASVVQGDSVTRTVTTTLTSGTPALVTYSSYIQGSSTGVSVTFNPPSCTPTLTTPCTTTMMTISTTSNTPITNSPSVLPVSITATGTSGTNTASSGNILLTVTAAASLAGSCSASPTTIATGQSSTWTATPTGGTGPYTYSWTGTNSLSGTTQSVTKSYSTTGTKTASVTVTDSVGATQTQACSNSVTVSTPIYTLSVSKAGTGKVVEFGGAKIINCGTTCSANYNQGLTAYVTALTPTAGHGFVNWTGASCLSSWSNPTCGVYMSSNQAVTANFIPTSYVFSVSPNTGVATFGFPTTIYANIAVSNLAITDTAITVSALSSGDFGGGVGFNLQTGPYAASATCPGGGINGVCNVGMLIIVGSFSTVGPHEIPIAATITSTVNPQITLTTTFTLTINTV